MKDGKVKVHEKEHTYNNGIDPDPYHDWVIVILREKAKDDKNT